MSTQRSPPTWLLLMCFSKAVSLSQATGCVLPHLTPIDQVWLLIYENELKVCDNEQHTCVKYIPLSLNMRLASFLFTDIYNNVCPAVRFSIRCLI